MGLAKSQETATRVNGVSGRPPTSSRTSLTQACFCKAPEPNSPRMRRVDHMPPMMPSRGGGAGMSDGFGTSQVGGRQTFPSGFSVRRSS